ncbi:uncharacterized protein AB9W97_015429 [Spinachia spinachia]
MDQGDALDFQALRAKFQAELFLKRPTVKPALPEKPRVVPPPKSPTHFPPVGARPSPLTSFGQSLEGRSAASPRVIFKEDKKESKRPLIQIKGREARGGTEKESAAQLVPAVPPPPANGPQEQGPAGLHEEEKFHRAPSRLHPGSPPPRRSWTSSLHAAPAHLSPPPPCSRHPNPPPPCSRHPPPLLPAPDIPPPLLPAPDIPPPLLPAPGLPGPDAAVEGVPAPLDFPPTPVFVADPPAAKARRPECDAAFQIECPPPSIPRPASLDDVVRDSPTPTPPPDACPSPPPALLISAPPLPTCASSPPPPQEDELPAVDAHVEVENMAEVEAPPPSPAPPTPPPASPKAERPTSALAVLSRVEDLSPGRKTSGGDKRIFNLLEKACRKTRPSPNSSPSCPIAPPNPTVSLPELPPVDYVGKAPPPKPVNGFNPRQLPPVMERIPEEGADPIPELLVVPPLVLFKRVLPDLESLDPLSEKQSRPTPAKLSPLRPPSRPALGDNRVPAPFQFSETDNQASDWGGGHMGLQTSDGPNLPMLHTNGTRGEAFTDPENPDPEPSPQLAELEDQDANGVYESTENVYESMPASGSQMEGRGDVGKKRKGSPKNPYAEAQPETNRAKSKTSRFGKTEKQAAAAGSDEKEQKKKEKQRAEKEKKELKEKEEREKKERKEREKKENEMKKKFKITGQEDAMYQAKVTVTTKGRKNDLPVTCGDVVSIIRTTNCPKGKWLARSSSKNFGYIAVDYVELDIKEMVELGKKATISHMSGGTNNSVMEDKVTGSGSRALKPYPMSAETLSDDSEEWTGDEEEPLSLALEPETPLSSTGHTRTLSLPDVGNQGLSISHAHSHSDIIADGPEVQARHEALQKLATFFHSPKPEKAAASGTEPEESPLKVKKEAVPSPAVSCTQEMEPDVTDMIILPPPDLYADLSVE